MPLADFHCHLEHPEFASDLQQVIERACRAGVAKAAVAGSNRLENEKILFLAGRYPEFVVPLIGVSPFDAASMPGQRLSVELDFIRKRAAGIAGIGEIGLDYHYFKEPQERDRQLDAFRRQLQLAESLGLPVAVHSRDAEQDVMNELADFPGLSIMLHCFLKPQLAKKAAACGWLISLPTIKSRDRVKIAKDLDLARLGAETDAPFLWKDEAGSAVRNEPANVSEVYGEIAAAKGLQLPAVADGLWANFTRLFGARNQSGGL